MSALAETTQRQFNTSVLGNQDYMFAEDFVLVQPSALITAFSMDGVPSVLDPGTYDFELPLILPADSTPTINT